MNKIITVTAFSLITATTYSQMFSVSADKMNVIYIGVPNPLSVAVENTPCNSIDITTNNGSIEKQEKCHYFIMPEKTGIADVQVYKTQGKNKKIIGEMRYRVKLIPDPTAKVGNVTVGELSKGIFCAQVGVIAYLENFDFDFRFIVTGFTVMILRGNRVVYSGTNTGARFDDEMLKQFKKVENGDMILFVNITGKGADGKKRNLNPVQITIK